MGNNVGGKAKISFRLLKELVNIHQKGKRNGMPIKIMAKYVSALLPLFDSLRIDMVDAPVFDLLGKRSALLLIMNKSPACSPLQNDKAKCYEKQND